MAKMGRTKRMLTMLTCVAGLFSACSSGEQPEATERLEQEAVLGPCAKHADCEDGNPCTQNLCALGLCLVPLPVLGCCFNGACNTAGAGGTAGTSGTGGKAGNGGGGQTTAGTGTGGALPLGCSIDAQCQDGNPCTQDLCLVGLCLPLPVIGCCYQGVCQDDGSAGAGGEPPIVTGGCSTNEQCDDNNACTQNLCVLGLCTTLPVLGCDGSGGGPPVLGCSTNEECEDGNDCIQNVCLLGLCASLPVIGGVCGGGGSGGGSAGSSGSGGTAGSSAGTAGNAGTAGSSAGNGGSAVGGETSGAGQGTGGSETANGGESNGGSKGEAGRGNPNGGTETGATGSGAATTGATATGATNTGATSASGGEAGEPAAGKSGTEWAMEGGACGCKVAGASHTPGSLSALFTALAAATTLVRRRHAAGKGRARCK